MASPLGMTMQIPWFLWASWSAACTMVCVLPYPVGPSVSVWRRRLLSGMPMFSSMPSWLVCVPM